MRASPQSITSRTPSMVIEVSATFVATTTFGLIVSRDGGVLIARRKFAVQWKQHESRVIPASGGWLRSLDDFISARHEDQHIALTARSRVSQNASAASSQTAVNSVPKRRGRYSISTGKVRPSELRRSTAADNFPGRRPRALPT